MSKLPPDNRTYCEHHFEIIKHMGVTEKSLENIETNLKVIYKKIEALTISDRNQDNKISGIGGFLKAHFFHITILITLIGIFIKLWRG